VVVEVLLVDDVDAAIVVVVVDGVVQVCQCGTEYITEVV